MCCETFFGKDLDQLFAYNTAKVVKIRDRYLGFIHYSCSLAIFVYVVLYVMLWKQGYLQYETPTGNTRVILAKDQGATSMNMTALSYCQEYTCRNWDEHSIKIPDLASSAVLITTHVNQSYERRVCDVDQPYCPYASPYQAVNNTAFNVAGVEDFHLIVYHSVQASGFYAESGESRFAGNSRTMNGKIVKTAHGGKKTTIKNFGHNYGDHIPMETILSAAEISLEQESKLPERKGLPIRQTGIVIYVHIRYSNSYNFFAPAEHIQYEYEFDADTNTETTVYEPVTGANVDGDRTLLVRNGIKFVFIQEGELGSFSVQTLLIRAVTALALLKFAQILVDLIALRAMPLRQMYRRHKYEVTEDYSDLRDSISVQSPVVLGRDSAGSLTEPLRPRNNASQQP